MNKKNILYICFIFFIVTILFQITILIKLNRFDKKIDRLAADIPSNISSSKPLTENPETASSAVISNAETETTEPDSSNYSDYEDLETVFRADNLTQVLSGTLFIGDSRTEGLYKFTPAADYADFCCGAGYNISSIREQHIVPKDNRLLMDSISEKKYKNIILCLGYNELGWDYPDTFISRYGQLIQDIKTVSPDTRIFVLAVLNVCRESHNLESYENNERIAQYNSLIFDMCQSNQVTYLDFNGYFIDSHGNLNPISTEDGIHFTAEYYGYYLYRILEYLK